MIKVYLNLVSKVKKYVNIINNLKIKLIVCIKYKNIF